MASVFQIATQQAVRDILEEHGIQGKFGIVLSEENLNMAAYKVTELFETTLMLRNKTAELLQNNAAATADNSNHSPQKTSTMANIHRLKRGAAVHIAPHERQRLGSSR